MATKLLRPDVVVSFDTRTRGQLNESRKSKEINAVLLFVYGERRILRYNARSRTKDSTNERHTRKLERDIIEAILLPRTNLKYFVHGSGPPSIRTSYLRRCLPIIKRAIEHVLELDLFYEDITPYLTTISTCHDYV